MNQIHRTHGTEGPKIFLLVFIGTMSVFLRVVKVSSSWGAEREWRLREDRSDLQLYYLVVEHLARCRNSLFLVLTFQASFFKVKDLFRSGIPTSKLSSRNAEGTLRQPHNF